MHDPGALDNAHSGHEQAQRASPISWRSSGRRFKSRRPDAGQRRFPVFGNRPSHARTQTLYPNQIAHPFKPQCVAEVGHRSPSRRRADMHVDIAGHADAGVPERVADRLDVLTRSSHAVAALCRVVRAPALPAPASFAAISRVRSKLCQSSFGRWSRDRVRYRKRRGCRTP